MVELAHLLDGSEVGSTEGALMVFAPHFVGLDVAWTALSLKRSGPLSTIYTPQSSKVADAWMRASRARFGRVNLFTREDGVKRIISGLKKGELLYLLPDMNFGPEESIFVPFFGIPAATVPSLSRFAKLSGARVIPVTTQMTDQGYEIKVHESFKDFPSEDFVRDTAFMNQWLEDIIKVKPDQYFWLHKRFKTRPGSEKSFYD
jgi:KDO2-lipid IV(A) lauroyltransferase